MDFKKLRSQKTKKIIIEPLEIFRRLPKPEGINDLYSSQAEVLEAWFMKRAQKDTILKLHTGGGKTLVGLLIAQSTLNETGEPVLYLVPTTQLVKQTMEKARAIGINVVQYEKGKTLNEEFVNSNSVMIATYKALFNGKSKFGILGSKNIQKVSAIIFDDAHVAFSEVRDSFTLEIKSDTDLYSKLTSLFMNSFKEIDKLGTYEDILAGKDSIILEVPYWEWNRKLDVVRLMIKENNFDNEISWPLIRDQLYLCHALVDRNKFTITPILPNVNLIPTFSEAPRRIFMSATITDDSDIVRTFDVDNNVINNILKSRSLAGISERMILIPDLTRVSIDIKSSFKSILDFTINQKYGAIILVSTDKNANDWSEIAKVAKGPIEVEEMVTKLQKLEDFGPFVFSNRYDGIDLPGNSCRLLVMNGLPKGTSIYEQFRGSVLFGGDSITRLIAQRIEQGIGRGSRGSGDYTVVILSGLDLSAWISKRGNFNFLTSATKAQLEIGSEISKEVNNTDDILDLMQQCFSRDKDWVEYQAESLAELVDEEEQSNFSFQTAIAERKAINLWQNGYYDKAIDKINQFINTFSNDIDAQTRGWLLQLSARIADNWGHQERALELQKSAFAYNRNLTRSKILPPYRPIVASSNQAKSIVTQIGDYKNRIGYLKKFEEVTSNLSPNASSSCFEQALCDFGRMIGFETERHDENGEGPDVLWLISDITGVVIEAKSCKMDKNPLNKKEHGQLLVAAEWFKKNYPSLNCIRVSVHPQNHATKAATAGASHALTYSNLNLLVADSRVLLSKLCESQLSPENLEIECEKLLSYSNINSTRLCSSYLLLFNEVD